MKPRPEEREIRGFWKEVAGKVEADENCLRIEELTQRYLHEVARDSSGWNVLFVDRSDGRHWELSYPGAASHGGGAPLLRVLTREEVEERYGVQ